MTATIHHGDCLDVLRGMPDNSVDAVVTDPPYGLSNTTPEKVADTIVRWAQGDREHVPMGKGFMGASWDAFVPPVAAWDECYRVLKHGGHLAVFAGSRTQDLMGLSIRLAGFDLRDSLAWLYGSGFPKSLDVGKAIERSKTLGDAKITVNGCTWIADRCDELGLSRKDLDAAAGTSDMGGWWASRLPHRASLPTAEQWVKLRAVLGDAPHWLDKYILPANAPGEAWERREVIGTRTGAQSESTGRYGAWGNDDGAGRSKFNVTTAATDLAKRYEGFGTSLKPAHEPIILARKPFPGTVAANVLEHGTGGLNIDATRIGPRTDPPFKYAAKAPKKERPTYVNDEGKTVQHSTVKPLSVMSWLVRLVTPPGGTVLDPFAGSGTTVEAALNEGFHVIGIEREAEYLPLIQQRIDRASERLPMAS